MLICQRLIAIPDISEDLSVKKSKLVVLGEKDKQYKEISF